MAFVRGAGVAGRAAGVLDVVDCGAWLGGKCRGGDDAGHGEVLCGSVVAFAVG